MGDSRPLTSRTLLSLVRDHHDRSAWDRFHALYAPLLFRFARERGLSHDDAEEVRDECLSIVVRKLPEFRYDPARGAFKGWLQRIVQGKVIDHLRRNNRQRGTLATTDQMATIQSTEPTPDEAWERSWRDEHLRFALQLAAERTSEQTFQAFELLLVHGATVAEVGERMGLNANQVYKAKARVLEVVRKTLAELDTSPPPIDPISS